MFELAFAFFRFLGLDDPSLDVTAELSGDEDPERVHTPIGG